MSGKVMASCLRSGTRIIRRGSRALGPGSRLGLREFRSTPFRS